MTAPWMPPLPEPDLPSTPIYYATSPITSRGPGPMYPPMWGADQMRQAQADAARAALEQAARWVRNRSDAYDAEHGTTDPETGAREYPGTGDEYMMELAEIEDGIRALAKEIT